MAANGSGILVLLPPSSRGTHALTRAHACTRERFAFSSSLSHASRRVRACDHERASSRGGYLTLCGCGLYLRSEAESYGNWREDGVILQKG